MLNNIWEKIKGFGSELWYFVSSRVFLGSFGKMFGILGLLLVMMFWMMQCFTNHGSSVKVGNYVGKSMKDVIRHADDNDFNLVVTDSVYREDMPADMVLEQNPAPNSAVKEGRTIYLKITTNKGSMQNLPDLAGRDQIEFYTETVRGMGIKIGHIDTLPDPNLADGTIKQIIWRGRDITNELGKFTIPQGSTLDFVISRKENNDRDVPAFISGGKYMSYAEYIALLTMSDLAVKQVVPDPSVSNEESAYVIKVSPSVGVSLQKGDSVIVFITQNNPAATRTDQFDN
jgi:beta-lactam-binding protein with PASTA domain